MLPGNDAVGVHTLRSASDHRLKVLAEVGRLELGVELGSEIVAEISRVIGVVVTSDAPRVLIFGEISGNEFDWVEGIGLARLSGRKHSAADRFFGDLCSERVKEISQSTFQEFRVVNFPYIIAIYFLLADFLHEIIDPVLSRDKVVRQDLLVQGPRILDDQCHVVADVPQVGKGCGHVSIANDFIIARGHGIVNPSGGKARV